MKWIFILNYIIFFSAIFAQTHEGTHPELDQSKANEATKKSGIKETTRAKSTSEVVIDHLDHQNHKRPDRRSPAGVMTPHLHGKDQWMFEYNYMGMTMNQLLDGSKKLDPYSVLYFNRTDPTVTMPTGNRIQGGNFNPTLNANQYFFMSAPTSMTMEMNMFSAMYGLGEKTVFMVMLPVLNYKMGMITGNFDSSNMSSKGVGDISGTISHNILDKKNQNLFLQIGISAPTGSIDNADIMPMMGKRRVPYNMQTGAGTWKILPAISYNVNVNKIILGTFFHAGLPASKNSNQYRFGNRYEATAWVSYLILDSLSASFRLAYSKWDNVTGQDAALDPKMDPQNNPNYQGGRRADALVGINYQFQSGLFSDFKFGIEFGAPFYQHLNGPQMGVNSLLNFFVQYAL